VSGLKPGEKLIAAGIQKIRDGAPVEAAAKPSAEKGSGGVFDPPIPENPSRPLFGRAA